MYIHVLVKCMFMIVIIAVYLCMCPEVAWCGVELPTMNTIKAENIL